MKYRENMRRHTNKPLFFKGLRVLKLVKNGVLGFLSSLIFTVKPIKRGLYMFGLIQLIIVFTIIITAYRTFTGMYN